MKTYFGTFYFPLKLVDFSALDLFEEETAEKRVETQL